MSNKPLNKILCAEDESDIREIIKISLEDIGGFDVKYCVDGFDAVETAKKSKPDLLLLDVMMPKMDGPSALKEIRKLPGYEKMPAVFMTAKVQTDEVAAYFSMGILDVINKPFDPMMLAKKLQEIWETHEDI